MLRGIFGLACAASMLLCIASIVIWVHSNWFSHRHYYEFRTNHTEFSFRHAGSLMHFAYEPGSETAGGRWQSLSGSDYAPVLTRPRWRWGSFAVKVVPDMNRHYVSVMVPVWGMVLLTGFLPAIWYGLRCLESFRGRGRARRGLCERCCYDLRASVQRCPECGLPVRGTRAARAAQAMKFARAGRWLIGAGAIGALAGAVVAVLSAYGSNPEPARFQLATVAVVVFAFGAMLGLILRARARALEPAPETDPPPAPDSTADPISTTRSAGTAAEPASVGVGSGSATG